MRFANHQFLFFILAAFLFLNNGMFAQDDAEAFNAARAIDDPAKRVEALETFIQNYPESPSKGRAYNNLFGAYLAINEGDKALTAAEKYLENLPENQRGSAYNSLAWQLAENKVGLETANIYAERAVEWARSFNNPRQLRGIIDTQAFVLYQLQDVVSKEVLQAFYQDVPSASAAK
jgi:tetratricopeptide (TPR) repeat protein